MIQGRIGSTIGSAILALSVTACGGAGGTPNVKDVPAARTFHVNGASAKFTEYQLPAGVTPGRLTVGPGEAVWFVAGGTAGKMLGRISEGGSIKLVSMPNPNFFGPDDVVASTKRAASTIVIDPTIDESQDDLVSVDSSGHTSLSALTDDNQFLDLAVDPSGRFWTTSCVEACTTFPNGVINPGGARPGGDISANIIAFGADGRTYITASNQFFAVMPFSAFVLKLSSSGAILNEFSLPDNSNPTGIVSGPDGNLWIAETGTNKIARMTTGGTVTEYPIPTANSAPLFIARGRDGALWFTESSGNAIGRVTTGGAITEFPVPTANAGLLGIAACSATCQHRRIWFSESTAGKIGKLEF